MKSILTAATLSLSFAVPAFAAPTAQDHETLFEALALSEIVEIMREEGISYGAEIGNDLFPGRINSDWSDVVERIYDPERMIDVLRKEMADEMSDTDLTPLIAFFTGTIGSELVSLEVSGRRALLDETVENASIEALEIAAEDNSPRYQLIKEFAKTNDLIETNVVGSLNSNYAFYVGLVDGGGLPMEITDEQILSDVWSGESEIRENTIEWLYSYLLMAYQPVPDDYIQAYIDISKTEEGKDLNRAMFTAFDVLFTDMSKALGLGASRFMVGEDL